MPAGGTYRLNRDFAAGASSEIRATIGPVSETENEKPNDLGLLRVGYSGASLQEGVEAIICPADNGSQIGPIDLPLLLIVETPCEVRLRPLNTLRNAVDIVLSVAPCEAMVDLYGTKTIQAVQNQIIPLPQWVQSVTVLTPGAFQFRDRAATALNAVAAMGTYPRPAAASDVIATIAGTIVLQY